jgi:hypothetical protein
VVFDFIMENCLGKMFNNYIFKYLFNSYSLPLHSRVKKIDRGRNTYMDKIGGIGESDQNH